MTGASEADATNINKRNLACCLAYHINVRCFSHRCYFRNTVYVQLKSSTCIPGPSTDMLYCFWTLNVELVFAMFIKNFWEKISILYFFKSLQYPWQSMRILCCAVPFFYFIFLIQNLLSVPIERKKKKIWAEIQIRFDLHHTCSSLRAASTGRSLITETICLSILRSSSALNFSTLFSSLRNLVLPSPPLKRFKAKTGNHFSNQSVSPKFTPQAPANLMPTPGCSGVGLQCFMFI